MPAIFAVAKKTLQLLDSRGEDPSDGIPPRDGPHRPSQTLPLGHTGGQALNQPQAGHPGGLWKASDATRLSRLDSSGPNLSHAVRAANNSSAPTPTPQHYSLPSPQPNAPQRNAATSDDSLGQPPKNLLHDSPVKPLTKGCNCRQSMCLKLYCPCFSAGDSCSPDCSCAECHNSNAHAQLRDSVAQRIEELNPFAFRSRFATTENASTGLVNARGCTCQRSQCAKYYCDCFKAGLKCSEICKCLDCTNHKVTLVKEDVEKYRQKIKRRRQKRTLYSVFGLQKKHRKARIQKEPFS